MKNIQKLFIFCILSITISTIFSQKKYSNDFMEIAIDARAVAMGNSVINTSDNVNAIYWNPANLTESKSKFELSAMHSSKFQNINIHDFIGVYYTNDNTNYFGFGIIRNGTDNIKNTLFILDENGQFNYNNISYFSTVDYGALISIAKKLNSNLSLGGNIKIINRRLGNFANAWGFGIDASIFYKNKKHRLGAIARDITTTTNFWNYNLTEEEKQILVNTNNEIPINITESTLPSFRLGYSFVTDINSKFDLVYEFGLTNYFFGKTNYLISGNLLSINPNFGIELTYKKLINLRCGINELQTVKEINSNLKNLVINPNIGLGVEIKNINIDYAFSNFWNNSPLKNSHVISLIFKFL